MQPNASDQDPLAVESLRGIGLFAALDDEVLGRWAARLPRRSYAAAEEVFRVGDSGRAMFVVLEGEVEIVRAASPAAGARVALIEPGAWFGEVALIGVTGRAVSARTTEPTRLLVLPARELRELYRSDLKSYALLTMNLARGLARKLQLAEAMLAEALVNRRDD